MADSLDLFDFLNRLRGRWRVWLIAACAGGAIGAGVTLSRPVRYVAVTHLLIETPPDAVGIFMMMSPSYLDSLKTYVTLAESATVRARAIETLSHAQASAVGGIDAEVPLLTRVVAIRADARDPGSALALSRAAAEQTLQMLNDARSGEAEQSGHRERLLLVDPGVAPQNPEERDVAGNAVAAAFFALVAAALYESVRYLAERSGRDA